MQWRKAARGRFTDTKRQVMNVEQSDALEVSVADSSNQEIDLSQVATDDGGRLRNSEGRVLELGAFAPGATAGACEPSAVLEHIPAQQALAGGENEAGFGSRDRAFDVHEVLVDLFLLDPQFLGELTGVHLLVAEQRDDSPAQGDRLQNRPHPLKRSRRPAAGSPLSADSRRS